jgi:hypothetical protein
MSTQSHRGFGIRDVEIPKVNTDLHRLRELAWICNPCLATEAGPDLQSGLSYCFMVTNYIGTDYNRADSNVNATNTNHLLRAQRSQICASRVDPFCSLRRAFFWGQ